MSDQNFYQHLKDGSFLNFQRESINKTHIVIYFLVSLCVVFGIMFGIITSEKQNSNLPELQAPAHQVPHPRFMHNYK